MKKIFALKAIFILNVLWGICTCQEDAKEENPPTETTETAHTELSIDTKTPVQTLDNSEIKYYKLQLNNTQYKNDSELIFEIFIPENATSSDPDIFISKVNKYMSSIYVGQPKT